jgi:hypothetical protein
MISVELYFFGYFYSQGKIIILDNTIKLKYIFKLTILTIVSLALIFVKIINIRNYYIYGIETKGKICGVEKDCWFDSFNLFFDKNYKIFDVHSFSKNQKFLSILYYLYLRIKITYTYKIENTEYENTNTIYSINNDKEYKIGEEINIIVKYNKNNKSLIEDLFLKEFNEM